MVTKQATVNPPFPVTILILRVYGCMLLTLYTHYVITIKKHLHNRIKIIEIEIKFHEIKLKLMIAITKSPTKDKIS